MVRPLAVLLGFIAGCPALFAQYAAPDSPSQQAISNILGAGARALGMGGAFTAVADDATASSWNPAGLAQLSKPEVTVVLDRFAGTLSTDWEYAMEFPDGSRIAGRNQFEDSALDYSAVGFAGATLPFFIEDRPAAVQVAYHWLSTFPSYRWNWTEEWVMTAPGTDDSAVMREVVDARTRGDFSGGIRDYSASLAAEVFSGVRLGITLNYLDADYTNTLSSLAHASHYDYGAGMTASWDEAHEESLRLVFSDFFLDLGLLWQVAERWRVGAVYHSAFTTDMTYRSESEMMNSGFPDLFPSTAVSGRTQVSWPDGWAAGAAFMPSTAWTVAIDYSVTAWSEARVDHIRLADYRFDEAAGTYVPTTVDAEAVPFPYLLGERQEDTWSLRLGVEYIVAGPGGLILPIRAGIFREKQMVGAWGGPAPIFDGFSLGSGLTYGHFQADIAWIRLTGEEQGTMSWIEGDARHTLNGSDRFTADRFMVSLLYRIE